MDLKGKKILILGFSTTGCASAKYFARQGADVYLSEFGEMKDGAHGLSAKEELEKLENLGVKVEFEGHSDKYIEGAEFCILSPSIPTDAPILKKLDKKGIKYFSDIEYLSNDEAGKVVLITGTNGKTTTTALTSHILNEKYKAPYCGNIGISPLEYKNHNTDYYVVEASSFQLNYSPAIKPKVGIFCNLTPDHILWHKSIENYFEAKARPFRNMDENDFAILNYDDMYTRRLGSEIKAQVYWFTLMDREALLAQGQDISRFIYLHKNRISFGDIEIINVSELQIVGNHNIQNAMCAIAAAKMLDLDDEIIIHGLKTFRAIDHRLQFIRTIEGTDYYNDSKATNPEASIVAINSFPNKKVVLIAGGRDKKTSLKDFINAVKQHIFKVVLIGEATQRFKDELAQNNYMSIVNSKTLEEAIDIASLDKPDVVLLSPACASFDMFNSYEERGEVFKNYVLSKK